MTFEQLLLDAFDQLDSYYISNADTTAGKSVSASLVADFARVRASIDSSRTKAATESLARLIPPQLTPQRLGQFMGGQGLCWVLEDFHKMPPSEKTALSQSLKIFSDLSAEYPDVKIIVIGATETAREVVEYDAEMSRRVSELLIPLMDEDELMAIILNGQQLLNLDFSDLLEQIVRYSMGVPSVCHQLALNVCLETDEVITASTRRVFDGGDLKPAVERWIRESSDTLKANFDRALQRHRVRKYDNCRLIVSALAGGPLTGMLHSEILSEIRKGYPDYPSGNLTRYLQELLGDDRGNFLRLGPDGRFRFTDPLHHTYAQITVGSIERPPSPRPADFTQVMYTAFESLSSIDWSTYQPVAYSTDVFHVLWPGTASSPADEGDDET